MTFQKQTPATDEFLSRELKKIRARIIQNLEVIARHHPPTSQYPNRHRPFSGGSPVATSKTIFSWENYELGLNVEDQPPYRFTSWSNGGGGRSHTVLIPAASSTTLAFSAAFVGDSFSLVDTVRNCSSTGRCGMLCEGHCQNDDECQSTTLFCYKKGESGEGVPCCTGLDGSNTWWCTVLNSSAIAASTIKPSDALTVSPTIKPSDTLTASPATIEPTLDTTAKPTKARVGLIGENNTTSIPTSRSSSQRLLVHSRGVLLWVVASALLVPP